MVFLLYKSMDTKNRNLIAPRIYDESKNEKIINEAVITPRNKNPDKFHLDLQAKPSNPNPPYQEMEFLDPAPKENMKTCSNFSWSVFKWVIIVAVILAVCFLVYMVYKRKTEIPRDPKPSNYHKDPTLPPNASINLNRKKPQIGSKGYIEPKTKGAPLDERAAPGIHPKNQQTPSDQINSNKLPELNARKRFASLPNKINSSDSNSQAHPKANGAYESKEYYQVESGSNHQVHPNHGILNQDSEKDLPKSMGISPIRIPEMSNPYRATDFDIHDFNKNSIRGHENREANRFKVDLPEKKIEVPVIKELSPRLPIGQKENEQDGQYVHRSSEPSGYDDNEHFIKKILTFNEASGLYPK